MEQVGTPDSVFAHRYDTLQLVLAYFNGVILLFGAVCNATLFAVLLRNRSLRKVRYFLAGNLTFADMGVCAVNSLIFLYNASKEHYAVGQIGCTAQAVSQLLLCSQSVLTLTAITYERYLTVVKGREFTGVAFLVFMPTNWCYSAALAAVPFIWAKNPYPLRSSKIYCSGGWYSSHVHDVIFTASGIVVVTSGLCGITLMYWRIFKSVHENGCRLTSASGQNNIIASSQSADSSPMVCEYMKGAHVRQNWTAGERRGLGKLANKMASVASPNPRLGPNRGVSNSGFTSRALGNEKVIARVTFTVSTTFFACWGVYNLMFFLEMITRRESSPLLDGIAVTLALFNSACNPFLFLFDKNINSAVKDAIGVKYLKWKFGKESKLPRSESLRSTRALSHVSAPHQHRRRSVKGWFRRRESQRLPNWMDISVSVTVNGMVTFTEPNPHSLSPSPLTNTGKVFGVEMADAPPGVVRRDPETVFSEHSQSANSDEFTPQTFVSSGSSARSSHSPGRGVAEDQGGAENEFSMPVSFGVPRDTGEHMLGRNGQHTRSAADPRIVTTPLGGTRASRDDVPVPRKLDRASSPARSVLC